MTEINCHGEITPRPMIETTTPGSDAHCLKKTCSLNKEKRSTVSNRVEFELKWRNIQIYYFSKLQDLSLKKCKIKTLKTFVLKLSLIYMYIDIFFYKLYTCIVILFLNLYNLAKSFAIKEFLILA